VAVVGYRSAVAYALMTMSVQAVGFLVTVLVVPGVTVGQEDHADPVTKVRISGRITHQDGSPISNVTLKCGNALLHDNQMTTLDDRGRFSFAVTGHHEYDLYIDDPTVEPNITVIGKIVVTERLGIDLGEIVIRFPSQHEVEARLQGPVRVGRSSPPTNSPFPLIAAVFVGASGTANIIDSEGKVVQHAKEKEQVGFSALRIFEDGRAAGWLADFPFCCASYPLSLALVVYRPGEPIHRFVGDGRALFRWCFVAGGKQVAFLQSFPNGDLVEHYELRDVETLRLIDKWDGDLTPKAPKWAIGMRP